jgi:short-subunit dehydrogenase
MPDNSLTCLVTGASSGVGAALARQLAGRGTSLVLQGRDAARLEQVAAACRGAEATVEIVRGDLAEKDALLQLADDFRDRPIGEAYLCAGVGDMRGPGQKLERPHATLAVASVNFSAAATLATAVAEGMLARGGGRIVLIGSVAGAFGLPMAPTYSASKAGLRIFAEGLGDGLAAHGISVTHIALGFVDTPMSQRLDCWKPGMLTPETAARRIIEAARRNRRSVAIPAWFGPLQWATGLVPPILRREVFIRLSVGQKPPR